jgi:TonB family protein
MFSAVSGADPLGRRTSKVIHFAIVVCLAVAGLQTASPAQKSDKAPARKLVYKVSPEYPWDLKRAHIGGTVRMDIVVSPRGTVETISVIGGNPILTETATQAVKKWKYAPADSESIVRVNVEFNPNH